MHKQKKQAQQSFPWGGFQTRHLTANKASLRKNHNRVGRISSRASVPTTHQPSMKTGPEPAASRWKVARTKVRSSPSTFSRLAQGGSASLGRVIVRSYNLRGAASRSGQVAMARSPSWTTLSPLAGIGPPTSKGWNLRGGGEADVQIRAKGTANAQVRSRIRHKRRTAN